MEIWLCFTFNYSCEETQFEIHRKRINEYNSIKLTVSLNLSLGL